MNESSNLPKNFGKLIEIVPKWCYFDVPLIRTNSVLFLLSVENMSFSLTRKTDYALVALATLVRESMAGEGPLSARQISERHELPLPILMNALKELHRAKLIDSRRGAGGGYFLTKDPNNISIRDVIEAIEGPVTVTLCAEDEEDEQSHCNTCQIAVGCPISDPMQKLNLMMVAFLSKISLKSLIANEETLAFPITGVNV